MPKAKDVLAAVVACVVFFPLMIVKFLTILLLSLVKLSIAIATGVPILICYGLAKGCEKISEKIRNRDIENNNIAQKISSIPFDALAFVLNVLFEGFVLLTEVLCFPFSAAEAGIERLSKNQITHRKPSALCPFPNVHENPSIKNIKGDRIFKAFAGSPRVPKCLVSHLTLDEWKPLKKMKEALNRIAYLPRS